MSAVLNRWFGFAKTSKKNTAHSHKGGKKKTAFSWRPAWLRRTNGSAALVVLKSFASTVVYALIGGTLLLGLGVGSIWLYRFATTSPFFAIKQVDVVGNVRISREMVTDYAGLHIGDNSLAVSIAKIERALLQTPWVEEVSVKRLLPDRFMIRVQERLPSFWVRRDGALYYADAHGAVIAPVETHNFLALPTLLVAAGSEEVLDSLQGYLSLLRSGRLPVEFGSVSAVSLTPVKGVELYMEDRELRFSIATDDFKGNLERLSITLADLARRNALGIVREIRAADGNVWVINGS